MGTYLELAKSVISRQRIDIGSTTLGAKFNTVTKAERLAAYEHAVNEANRNTHRAVLFDWRDVDAAADQILSAQNHTELMAGVKQYVAVVAVGNREYSCNGPKQSVD